MKKAVFKPMPKLTALATGLIGLNIAVTATTMFLILYYLLLGEGDPGHSAYRGMGLSLIAQLIMYVLSAIVTLVWLYGTVRNARTLSSSLKHKPAWAVGWYFIPIANLYKPYEVLRDTFNASRGQGDGRYATGNGTLLGWWILHLIGCVVLVGAVFGAFNTEAEFYVVDMEWLWVGSVSIALVSTVLFLKILRTIYRDQMNRK